ncbi:MAG: hypothetical protein ACHREM_18195 [Polyangiales bacterium]
MAGYVLLLVPPTTIDVGQLLAPTTGFGLNWPLARRIDVSQAQNVALAARLHSSIPANTTISFYLSPDGYTSEDPTDEFGPVNSGGAANVTIYATLGPYTSATITPRFDLVASSSWAQPPGGLVYAYMQITRNGSAGAGIFKFSLELHMKSGNDTTFAPAAGSYLGFGSRRL